MIDVRCHKDLSEQPGFSQVIKDFKSYLESGKRRAPSYFGKDVPYTWPEIAVQAELWHMHLQLTPQECKVEPPTKAWDPTREQRERTSNKYLVYTRGETDPNIYIIIAVIFPRAHEQSRLSSHVGGLVAIAERARAIY